MDKDLFEFLQAFREEITKRLDEMDQRFNRRFDEMDQRFNGRFDEMDQRFNGRFDEMDQRFNTRLEALGAEIRGAYVLIEDLRGTVQLVAEGVTSFTQQLKRQGEEFSRRLDTIESFNRLTYQDLDIRVRRLEAT